MSNTKKYNHEYYLKNRQRLLEEHKKWQEKNPYYLKDYCKSWRQKQKENI